MQKVVTIIQARMGSTRLPGKVMMRIADKTVLGHVIERVKQAEKIDEIVIATTTNDRDDVIVKEAKNCGVKHFRGSEEDVLSRYYHAAKENAADIIVRVTSDCPLIDPYIVDKVINFYLDNEYALVTNAGIDLTQRTYPRGMDTEVFPFAVLEDAFLNADKKYQREHVTPYIYENYNDNIYIYKNGQDLSNYRLTLDTQEDFILIQTIYEELYEGKHDFYLNEIVQLFKSNPEYAEINREIKQKDYKDS